MKAKRTYPIDVLLVVAITVAVIFSCSPVIDLTAPSDARITSFSLPVDINPTFPQEAKGIIDEKAKLITLRIAPTVTDYSTFRPRISLTPGSTVYPASDTVVDFTANPVAFKATDSSGRTAVYQVRLIPKVEDAPQGAVRFTEYFCGTGSGTSTTGELNRYIELYNAADVAVDLSQFELVHNRFRSGSLDPSLSQSAILKGTVPAKSFFILYGAQSNATLLAKALSHANKASDKLLNGILDSDGASCFELRKDGVTIDVIGPGNGTPYATKSCLYRRSDTSDGNPRGPSTEWKESDWLVSPVSGILGDDANAGKASLTDASMIGFLVTQGQMSVAGNIDTINKTIAVLLPDGMDKRILDITVGTYAASANIDGIPILGKAVTLDFSQGNKTLTVKGQDGTEVAYSISMVQRFTTVNYDFDGNIQKVLDKIWLKGSEDSDLGGEYVTGVVTAKNIFPDAFVIQDKNAGLYFYTSTGVSFPVGAKVKIKVTTGKVYFGLPEVTVYDENIEALSSSLQSIYYETGDYANRASIAKVFKYTGAIAQGGLSYYKGQFAGNLWFHYPSAIQSYLKAGVTGEFVGPVSYTRDNYTMEIVTMEQFVLK